MHENNLPDKLIEVYEKENEEVKSNKRCLLYYAYSLAKTGKVFKAEEILCGKDGYLIVPDIRECELTETELWFYIQELKGKSKIGLEPPRDLDFRMFTKREGWF